jgi:hypothetical protein
MEDHGKIIVYLVIMLFGFGIFPLMEEAIVNKDMSGWAFTGSAFLIQLFRAFPYIWLAAFIFIPAYMIFRGPN